MADWLEGNEAVEKLKQIAASGKLETGLQLRNANCTGQLLKGLMLIWKIRSLLIVR